MTSPTIPNKEVDDIIKKSGLLIKGVSETIGNEVEKQKSRFISILLGKLDASLLGDLSSGKGVIQAGEGTLKVWQSF